MYTKLLLRAGVLSAVGVFTLAPTCASGDSWYDIYDDSGFGHYYQGDMNAAGELLVHGEVQTSASPLSTDALTVVYNSDGTVADDFTVQWCVRRSGPCSLVPPFTLTEMWSSAVGTGPWYNTTMYIAKVGRDGTVRWAHRGGRSATLQ